MSENPTQQVQAEESAPANATGELAENEMETVAGGGWLDDIAAAVIDAITPDIPTVY